MVIKIIPLYTISLGGPMVLMCWIEGWIFLFKGVGICLGGVGQEEERGPNISPKSTLIYDSCIRYRKNIL